MRGASDEIGEDPYWIYTGEEEVPDDVTHVRVSDDVIVLPAGAFIRRERLVVVELNEGLVLVQDHAFHSCTSLECVRIPSSVTTIGECAFSECAKLSHVAIPEEGRLEAIRRYAFYGCVSLTEITLPRSLSHFGGCSAFQGCSRLTRVDLANTVLVAIEETTFYDCNSLEDVHLPVTLKRIGTKAFKDCTSLSTIILHEGTTTIDTWAYHRCKNLSIDKLPSTLETIGCGAFDSCNLRHFVSPLHCKELHISAFDRCEDLKSIQIVGDDTMLINDGISTFFNVEIPSLLRLNVPKSYHDGGARLRLRPGHFLSNASIEPNSSMSKNDYTYMFSKFKEKGCDLDRMKARFEQLPLHEICFDYSNQHTEVTFEQVLKCLEENPGALREKDCIGMTPLHIIACSTNHDVRLFQKLISRCREALMDRDIFGRTALDYALLSDAPEEVFYLLFEPFVQIGDLPLNLELINGAVEHSVPALKTWEVFSDYIERFFPALDLDWERLFSKKVHQNADLPIETYRWFARKAAKQRMIKMNTLTSTRKSKINEMVDGFQSWAEFPHLRGDCHVDNQWICQVGPVWKLMKRWELKEAAALLELALWKRSLNNQSGGGGSRAAARVSCGAEVIINEVVQFLSYGDFEKEIFGELFTIDDGPMVV